MKRISFAVALAFLLLGNACASVGVTEIKPGRSKPLGCQLDVWTSVEEIPRPHVVACLIDSKTGSSAFDDKTAAGAIKLARPAACECGADALLIANTARTGVSAYSWGEGMATVKAIRYTGPAPTAPPTPAP
jgi:hypothetical protein